MRIVFCSILALVVLGAAPTQPAPSTDNSGPGMRAYWTLVNAVNWPKDVPSPSEQRAIDVIRTAPQDVVSHLTAVLSAGGTPERNALYIAHLLPAEVFLQIVRGVILSFPPGEVPASRRALLGSLAAFGQEQDMARIRTEIEHDPDVWGRSYALAIAATRNPAGLKMLRALRGELKGEWQNDPIVKAALEEGAPTSRPTTQPLPPGEQHQGRK
jgi:hypothetical protein